MSNAPEPKHTIHRTDGGWQLHVWQYDAESKTSTFSLWTTDESFAEEVERTNRDILFAIAKRKSWWQRFLHAVGFSS